jgi:hypothetical protein
MSKDPRIAALDEDGGQIIPDSIRAEHPVAIVKVNGDATSDDVERIRLGWELGEAEIDRFRRIEEAARAVLDCCAIEETWGREQCAEHDALRAALTTADNPPPGDHD